MYKETSICLQYNNVNLQYKNIVYQLWLIDAFCLLKSEVFILYHVLISLGSAMLFDVLHSVDFLWCL